MSERLALGTPTCKTNCACYLVTEGEGLKINPPHMQDSAGKKK